MPAQDGTLDDDLAAERARDIQGRFGPGRATDEPPSGDGPAPPPLASMPLPQLAADGAPRFRVGTLLGRGGGGEVWAVEDRWIGRTVAVKVQHRQGSGDAARSRRFAAEVRTTAHLEHPGILPVYELGGTDDGRLWFSMRRAEGTTLADAIAGIADGAPPESVRTIDDRVQVMVRVCEAVAYAHDHGVVHRDLKPGNIMLGRYGEVLVVDWGSAGSSQEAQARGVVGTPLYMAPEQARGEAVDAASDVYGLGATLWHLLTLQPPLAARPDTDDFWERKRQGDLDPVPDDCHVSLDLLLIARQALAADRGQRPSSALELARRLRDWLRGREGAGMRERALAALAQLERHGDHAGFGRVADDLRTASALGDPQAAALLARARQAHARFAIMQGDLRLAGELAEAGSPEAAQVLAAQRRRQHLRWAVWGASAAAALLLIALATYAWREHRSRTSTWQTVWERTAADSRDLDLDPDRRWEPPADGLLEPTADGCLIADAHLLWLKGVAETGDVRLEAEVSWPLNVEELRLHLNASDALPTVSIHSPPGFSAAFGGTRGLAAAIRLTREPKRTTPIATAFPGFVPGRIYRLEATRRGTRITAAVDGIEILRHDEILPPQGDAFRRIAIQPMGRVMIHRLRVQRMGIPEQPGPLATGDAFLAVGEAAHARAAFRRVAEDHPGGAFAEAALARAALAAANDPDATPELRAEALTTLESRFPGSPFIRRSHEAAILAAWLRGEYAAALDAAAVALQRWPESGLAQDLANQRQGHLTGDEVRRLTGLLGRTHELTHLDLRGCDIEDIAFLAGKHLHGLALADNRISDLRPLAGMPLRELDLADNPVTDLAPVQGLPLVQLLLDRTPVADLAPLHGLPLRVLSLRRTAVTDLSPLAGMPLEHLNLVCVPAQRLPDAGWQTLRYLDISDSGIVDLAPLSGASALSQFIAYGSPITDLSPLRGCRRLFQMAIPRSRVTDLSPLAGLRLRWLEVDDTGVSDLGPLAGQPIERLSCARSGITDLRPAMDGRMVHLNLNGTGIASLAGVQTRYLDRLWLDDTPITDLSPLTGSPLRSLGLGRATWVDPGILFGLPRLAYFSGKPDPRNRRSWDEAVVRLRQVGKGRIARQVETHLAVIDGDTARLRRNGIRHGNRIWSTTGTWATAAEAQELARRHGARLPSIATPEEETAILAADLDGQAIWLGLEPAAGGGLQWADGRAMTFNRLIGSHMRQPQQAAGWYIHHAQTRHILVNEWRMVGSAQASSFRTLVVLEWDAAP